MISVIIILLFIVKRNIKQSLTGPEGSRSLRLPGFQDNRHIKIVRLSGLRTSCLNPPGNISGTRLCYRLNQLQCHISTGRIMLMTNSSDTIGNWTRDLSACSAVPQPTAPNPAPIIYRYSLFIIYDGVETGSGSQSASYSARKNASSCTSTPPHAFKA